MSVLGERRWIYLPVEIQVRGFDSRLLLACFAAARGYMAVVGAKNSLHRKLDAFPPGAYIGKSLAPNGLRIFQDLKRRGHRIACIDEETTGGHRRYYQKTRYSQETLDLADAYFAIGEYQRDVLLEVYPDAADKVYVTGNPRIDLWRLPFHSIYEAEAAALRKRLGPFLFFPSNFGSLSHVKGFDFILEMAEKQGFMAEARDRDYFHQCFKHAECCRDHFAGLLSRLSSEFANHTIVIRPHPVEEPAFWEEIAKRHPGIRIEREGSVTPYLLATDCMIHHGCTTGIESYFLNRPAVAYLPEFNREIDRNPSVDLSARARTADEAVALIAAAIGGGHAHPKDAATVAREQFANSEGAPACERIVNTLDDISVPLSLSVPQAVETHTKQRSTLLNRVTFDIREILRSGYRKIKTSRRKGNQASESTGNAKWTGKSIDAVRQNVKQLAQHEETFAELQVAEVAKNLFCLWRASICPPSC